jgi:DNA-directed RNA polymerase specialized sigma subunit
MKAVLECPICTTPFVIDHVRDRLLRCDNGPCCSYGCSRKLYHKTKRSGNTIIAKIIRLIGCKSIRRDLICTDDPLEIVMDQDLQELKKRAMSKIIEAARLSARQFEVLALRIGLNGISLSNTETALKLDITRQRVGQQYTKCLEKLRVATDSLGYEWGSFN